MIAVSTSSPPEVAGPFASRVLGLVEFAHPSVNAAAKAIGIPQRTLARIVTGEMPNPRAEVLRRIAAFYDVSVDWLLTGKGKGPGEWTTRPLDRITYSPKAGWHAAVRQLALDPDLENKVLRLPRMMDVAVSVMALGAPQALVPAAGEAIRWELEAWTTLVRALIQHLGFAEARERVLMLLAFETGRERSSGEAAPKAKTSRHVKRA
jgi:transcriptional regulator with XRE-family HTH domain